MGLQHLSELKFNEEEIEIGGEKYLVREMDCGDFGKYQASLIKFVNNKPQYKAENAQKNMIMYSLRDLDGSRVYSDKDLALVDKLPKSIAERIFEIAAKLNGIGEESAKN